MPNFLRETSLRASGFPCPFPRVAPLANWCGPFHRVDIHAAIEQAAHMNTRGLGAGPPEPSGSSTSPLSEQDRAVIARARGTRLPTVFVLLSLAFAVLLPQLSQRRVAKLRNEISGYTDPARQRLTSVQLYLTRGAAQQRGYALTREERYLKLADSSRARRADAERELIRYAHALDGSRHTKLTELATKLQRLDREVDSMVTLEGAAPMGPSHLSALRARGARLQLLADTLGRGIDAAAELRRENVATIETISMVLTGILVVFGLGASFLVAQLGMRYRNLTILLHEQRTRFLQIAENLSDVV